MKKIRVGLMTSVIDNRKGAGTALVARRFLDRIDRYTDTFDFTLIHYDKTDDPLYEKYPEMLMPPTIVPVARQLAREVAFWCHERMKGNRFDIVHYLNPRVWPSYVLTSSKNIIITAHDAGIMLDLTPSGWGGKTFQFTNRYLHGRMSRIIAGSAYGKDEIARTYHINRDRIAVVLDAVDATFKPSGRSDCLSYLQNKYGFPAPYILSVGRFDPHKNILTLLDAFALLLEKSFPFNLVLVGGPHWPAYSKAVEERVAALNRRSKGSVYISPYIEEEDLADVYAQARTVVYPSLHEGFGLPVLEAFACRTPLAAANATALPETAGGAAALFDPNDPQDMARVIDSVSSDENIRGDLIAKGTHRLSDFSWDQTADQTIKVYESLIDPS